MDFSKMDIGTISNGVSGDGVRYLQTFLQEYSKLFGETVNPSCSKCLTSYLERYKKHIAMKNAEKNTSGYVLHAKYEGIPLEFGSQIFVTNDNITEAYAKKLLSHENGERFFAVIPAKGAVKAQNGAVDRETLTNNLQAAQDAVNSLGEKPHHATKAKADKNLQVAQDALAAYDAANPPVIDTEVKELEVTLTEDDVTGSDELKEAGFAAGDIVVIDAEQFEADGTLHILRKKE